MTRFAIAPLAMALAVLTGATFGQTLGPAGEAGQETPLRTVLIQEDYPWYDRERDEVRPVLPDPSSWTAQLGKRVAAILDWIRRHLESKPASDSARGRTSGSLLPSLLFFAAGCVFLVLLWRLWQLHEPRRAPEDQRPASVGEVARMAGLGAGSSLEGLDPWSEASRRRAAGDLAGAVVWLFVDQLFALNRAGLIHVTPGRTARQYMNSLAEPSLRVGLGATIGAFEDVYYGRRSISSSRLETLWLEAEAFRGRLAKLGRAS